MRTAGEWVRWEMPDMIVWACYVGMGIVAVVSGPATGLGDFVVDLR